MKKKIKYPEGGNPPSDSTNQIDWLNSGEYASIDLKAAKITPLSKYQREFIEANPIEDWSSPLSALEKGLGYSKSNLPKKTTAAYNKAQNNYIAKRLLEDNPREDWMSRLDWLNRLTPMGVKAIENSNSKAKIKPNLFAQFENAMLGSMPHGNANFKNSSTTDEEFKNTSTGDLLKPLQVLPNVVNTAFKGKGTQGAKEALLGQPSNMGAAKEMILDPTTYLGLNTYGKMTKEVSEALAKKGISKYYNLKNYKAINELKAYHNNTLVNEIFYSPEGRRRLSNLKLDADELIFDNKDIAPSLTFEVGDGSFFSPMENRINVDTKQLSKLKINPKTAYEHELGHWIQELLPESNPITSPFDNFQFTPPKLTNIDKNLKIDVILNQSQYTSANKSKFDPKRSKEYFMYNREPLAHIREMRQNMINENIIKDKYQKIDPAHVQAFLDTTTKDRIASFVNADLPRTSKTLAGVMNYIPSLAAPVAATGIGTYYLDQLKKPKQKTYKSGGWLDNE